MLVKAYIDTYHFPANVTNTSNNYGPYQFPEKLIPLIINNALHGKKLPVYGDGLNIRDWLYVDDHAKGIDMAQEHGKLGESYMKSVILRLSILSLRLYRKFFLILIQEKQM